MAVRFGRTVILVLASQVSPAKKSNAGRFFRAYTRQTVIENLRIRFTVEKTLGKDSNSATIYITNLASKTRSEFQTKPAHITLNAGYAGENKMLYRGDIRSARSYRKGTEWETEVVCGTGEYAALHARVSASFGPGTTRMDMIKAVVDTFGLKMPSNVKGDASFLQQVASGKVLRGSSLEMLQKIAAPSHAISIQDDTLVIIKKNGVRFVTGIRIAQDTGMIGTPELGTPEQKGGKPVLTVKTLLNPDLQAGGYAQLRTDTLNGDYKIFRAVHTGDTHGQEWYTTIEGKSL